MTAHPPSPPSPPPSRPASPPPWHAAHVSSREVHKALEAYLRSRGLPKADVEDLRQRALLKLYLTPVPPPDLTGCVALAIEIVKALLIDDRRALRRRGKYDVGSCENPDGHAAGNGAGDEGDHPIDRRKKLEVLAQQVAAGKITRRQVEIIAHTADGVPQAEIARKMGVARQTVKNELAEGRGTAREAWAIYAPLIVMGLLCLVVWILRDRNPKEQAHPPDAGPEPVQAPPEPTLQQRAGDLRRSGLHDCDLGRWKACADALEEAGRLDPDGNAAPAVEKALREALKQLRTPPFKQ